MPKDYEQLYNLATNEIDRIVTRGASRDSKMDRASSRIIDLEQKLDEAITRYETAEEMAVVEAEGHDNEAKYLLQQKELEALRTEYALLGDELRVSENEACELKQELGREKHASGQARVRAAHTNDEFLQEKAVADYATRLIRRLMDDIRGCDCKDD